MEEFTSKNDMRADRDVILPAEKKVTLQPVHADVHIDDESDIQIAASHANGTPIGNISSDRETTNLDHTRAPAPAQVSVNKQPDTPHPVRRVSYKSVTLMLLITAALLFALLYR